METLILRVFRFFKRLFWPLILLMVLIMALWSGPFRGATGWGQSMLTASTAILFVIVGTVAIVTTVESGRGSPRR